MRRFHLVFGLLLFVVFLITGQFMNFNFPDKDAMSQELRLLLRSRHIYILFCALIHLALGIYLQMRPESWRKYVQYTGSGLLTFAAALLLTAFIRENYYLLHASKLSAFGIFASFGGVLLHMIGGFKSSKHEQ